MPHCCFCQSPKTRVIFSFDGFKVVKCLKCGLLRRNSQLSSQGLHRLFSKKYFTQEQKDYFIGQFAKRVNLKLPRNQSFLSRLKTLEALNGHKHKTLLDVGCGSGVFLKIARDRGWQVTGVDISAYPVKFARRNFGLKVLTTTLEAAKFPSHHFNVITTWDVMSNFQHPETVFQQAFRVLRPGGIFAFELAVVDSLLNLISDSLYLLSFGQLKSLAQRGYPFQHAYHFTRQTIHQFAKKYGFTTLKQDNTNMEYRYSSLPKQLIPLLRLSDFVATPLQKTTRYRLYLQKPG